MKYEIKAELLEKTIERLLDGLKTAIQLIRAWHGMGMPADQEERIWAIYNGQSPEMKELNNIIEKIESQLNQELENGCRGCSHSECKDYFYSDFCWSCFDYAKHSDKSQIKKGDE